MTCTREKTDVYSDYRAHFIKTICAADSGRSEIIMDIFWEIFGYIGTALVIISMTMTSLLKLRVINLCGGVISLIYAIVVNAWPVVVLNACLVGINGYKIVREVAERIGAARAQRKTAPPTNGET